MEQDMGVADKSAGLSSQATAPKVAALRASIPNAPRLSLWVDQRRRQLRWETNNGPVVLDYPNTLRPEEIDDLEQVLAINIGTMRRTAQAIEAGTVETERLDAKHESAVGETDAPETIPMAADRG